MHSRRLAAVLLVLVTSWLAASGPDRSLGAMARPDGRTGSRPSQVRQPPVQLPLTPRAYLPYAVRNANPWKPGVPLAVSLPGYEGVWYRAKEGLASDRVQAIAVDKRGTTWFGTDAGAVALMPDDTLRVYTANQDDLAYDDVAAIVVDHAGEGWFGGNLFGGDGVWGAVSRFDGRDVYTWRNTGDSGVSLGVIQAMAIGPADDKWLATDPEWSRWAGSGPGGVIHLTGRYYGQTGWDTWASGAGLSFAWSDDVTVDTRGNVWVLANGRLARRSPSGTWSDVAAAEGQPEGTVQGIAVDPSTDALVVTTGTRYDLAADGPPLGLGRAISSGALSAPRVRGGPQAADDALLWRAPGGKWTRQAAAPASGAQRLAVDGKGNLWFARDPMDDKSAGVRWADGTWSFLGSDEGPLARIVFDVYVDPADNVWYGTSGGAVELRRK
jgi:ligand-binding sensor domain-containing protein